MRASQFFINTLKEAPSDAEIISHQLMLRAGLIRRLAGGIYTWMPLGLRVLRKVENIVREEMNRAGAMEMLMPAVQPFELWEESGRGPKYGPELLRLKDRHQRDFVIGPTHEEVITDVVRREVKSYRQLPRHFYQIQTKFRDEIRPRFGVMRGREFLMKDGYSFHTSFTDLQREYQVMYETYSRIFARLGLKFRAVAADTGAIGGTGSHEFHVLADSGEDAIAYCPDSDFAANVELAEAVAPENSPVGAGDTPLLTMQKVATPGKARCEDVAEFLGLPLTQTVKCIALVKEIKDSPNEFVLLLLRGDHNLNEIKAQKVIGEFRFAREDEIVAALGSKPGYIGPVGYTGKLVVDRAVASMANFVCGANDEGFHLTGVNFGRDLPAPSLVADIRNVLAGDPSPDGKGKLELCRGIEVGHIFQLRTKYAEALKCTFLDESGKDQVMEMGCYGIGISRIVGAAIEQGNDPRGIIFPTAIAPFSVVIVPMNYAKSETVRVTADKLHDELREAGIDVMLDDRDERAGSMFADWELIGVPHRVVVGERGLKDGKLEYKGRTDSDAALVDVSGMLTFLQQALS
jgi:prolyl-tRNA synthetase